MIDELYQAESSFWKILPHEKKIFHKKKGAAYFVYLLLFKWFEQHACFPDTLASISNHLIEEGIALLEEIIHPSEIAEFFTKERTITRYKQEIRQYFEFCPFNSECSRLNAFLLEHIYKEKNDEILLLKLVEYLKNNKTEVPQEDVLLKLIKKVFAAQEQVLFNKIASLLSSQHKSYIDDYVLSSDDFDGVCQFLRQDSGSSTKKGVKEEIQRFNILIELPMQIMRQIIEPIHKRRIQLYRRRFLTDTPKRTKRRAENIRYALTMIFCYQRHEEAIDNLVEHLDFFIHKIKKVEDKKRKALNEEVGKRLDNLDALYLLAEINRDNPKSIIEEIVYPAVPQEIIDHIIKTRDFARKIKKKTKEFLIRRYSNSYRRIILNILACLNIQSNNTDFLQAQRLIKSHQDSKQKYYPLEENIPMKGLISAQQQKDIFEKDDEQQLRVLRKEYECAVFKQMRLKLNHKEAWVENAYKYRDPAKDLPQDFESRADYYFSLLSVPRSAKAFTDIIKEKMQTHLKIFDDNLSTNPYVKIIQRQGKPSIVLTPLEKINEPQNLQRLKKAILEKWGMIDLLDMVKEVDLRENYTNYFSTAGNREILDADTLRKRLLLCLFGLGTNAGLKRTAGASKGAVTFEELRHVKNFYLNKDDLREAINFIVNRIFAIRNTKIWKSVSTACAADSKQFGSASNNLLTEWSPRHASSGVMIYWHVSDQYICVYSQLKSCTSSEVASMLQGILSQETDMEIESQYVDSHGKSELGFALSYFEDFDLLPRYKSIDTQKLHFPSDDFSVTHIRDITTHSIDWDLIESEYEEMVKHAVALKIGTATADSIIRKFARSNYQHPTFKAFIELGKAIKTIFLCRYLDSLELRQQINAGLNVVENWNSANEFVRYGNSGEITSNVKDDQEISMLCLHFLQTSISYMNTLLMESILQEDNWQERLTPEDYRALNALFYLHINPYGSFEVDFNKRLDIRPFPTGIKT